MKRGGPPYEEIFIISLFFKSSDFDFRSKKGFFCSFWLIFYALDPNLWIRIFLKIWIWIQEDKFLRIQRIQIQIWILSTGLVGDYINTIKTTFFFNFDLYQAIKQHGNTKHTVTRSCRLHCF